MSNIQKLENISQEFRFTVTVNHVKHSKEYAKSFFAPPPRSKSYFATFEAEESRTKRSAQFVAALHDI